MQNLQAQIVAAARTWLGTRFHHQGRLKKTTEHKGGCDCLGLLVGVAGELGLTKQEVPLISFDRTDYGHVPDGELLKQMLSDLLQEIELEDITPGDVLLFHFEGNPQHLAIVSDYAGGGLGIIHCYAQARKVVEHCLDDKWKGRLTSAFRLVP